MDDSSRYVMTSKISIINQSAFEALGFTFESAEFGETKIVLPEGWVMADIDNDAFTTDFIDPDGCSHGKFCCGNYPRIPARMWLYKELRPNAIEKDEIPGILESHLKWNKEHPV